MAVALWQQKYEERAELIREGDQILEAASSQDGGLTEEQRTRLLEINGNPKAEDENARLGLIGQLDADIDLYRRQEERQGRQPEPRPNADLTPDQRGALGQHEPRIEVRDRDDRKGPFGSLGEQLQAVYEASLPGAQIDPRLGKVAEMQAAASGASVAVPSDGGFLVQADFSTQLLQRAIEAAVLAPRTTPLTIGAGSNAVELPYIDETSRATGSRYGGVQVYRRAEADAVTASKPKLAKKRLEIEDLMGIAYATEELLADATAIESIFTVAFTSEFSFKLDDEIFNGSGVGECLGIINAANDALVSQAKETGQAADSIVAENLSKMWTHMPPRNKPRSVWLINSEVTPELDRLYIAAGTGAIEPRIVTYSESGAVRIKGRPVIEIEQASALGDAGDIVLVDLSEYLLARKGGLQADQSMHVRFLNNERTFRWIMRVNGMPTWRTSLTPYKGSATLSPYVSLAARA